MNRNQAGWRQRAACGILVAGVAAWAGPSAVDAAEGVVLDASVAALSQYIWRGFEYSQDGLVLQPSVTLSWQGWAANLWANYDSNGLDGVDAWNETDLTVSYAHTLGPATLTLSYLYYAADAATDSEELALGVSFDCLAGPSLTVYREVGHFPSWYLVAGVGHGIPLTEEISLDLSATAGLLLSDDADAYAEPESGDEFRGMLDGHLRAAATIPLVGDWTITPELNYSFPLTGNSSDLIESLSRDGDDARFLYGGVTVAVSF